ncbi:MAG: phenylalanine--tRNA ligase subunit alpha [Gammaproteobacteria bacterium CG11_big_fil_rev_8_21_14_0_20_46_22]|nr:MAG: phenylalanine--tRNA ligase subunit alpha [Gammaproteobacteria bacterium CG12_big_fil_rev_8_21_14_0_65_46_12]PIR11583.1 MAG: phenylalanine--tRNA ligase subunit alpha [Gammaproteobacteria bacterium CG11_big_fil_rev_8_21_14_0_20_46_22]
MQDFTALTTEAQEAIAKACDKQSLVDLRVHYLGKKGVLTESLKNLGQLSAEERPLMGQKVNEAKEAISEAINQKMAALEAKALADKLASEAVDVTLPGRATAAHGSLHPVSQAKARIARIFSNMGFRVADGPEIEDDFHNFTALNIPEHHPARAMHDTFYFGDGYLLRTHMSSVQIRDMRAHEPPIRLVAMGRVYRCDFDVTHTPMFHQLEGLYVAEKTSFAELKSVLKTFLAAFFDKPIKLRFRPSYFPFTEPSTEVDMQCVKCEGAGCRICKQSGWLEILGAGMVHPNVLKAVNIDPERYSGFAFGVGIDRLAMLYYGIDDLRSLFENDVRFLEQF